MNSWMLRAAVGLSISGSLCLAGTAMKPAAGVAQAELVWETDYTKATRQARDAGKPLFVVFR